MHRSRIVPGSAVDPSSPSAADRAFGVARAAGADSYYVPAQDSKGHTERVQYRVQPGHLMAAEELLAAKQFPWKRVSDFGRWSFALGLVVASKLQQNSKLTNLLSQTELIVELVRHQDFRRELEKALDELSVRVNAEILDGRFEDALALAEKGAAAVEACPESEMKEKYRKMFAERFGQLMRAMGRKGKIRSGGQNARLETG